MKLVRRVASAAFAFSALGALVAGGLALASASAEAGQEPLCGPTFQWTCSGPGGPDVLFEGTVCERDDFEKESGLACKPFGG
jgi:hypothetical protein